MAKSSKKKSKASPGGFQIFDDPEPVEAEGDDGLPKDEVGRQKIKQQYLDLLGIRLEKLKGRILNRERINKTVEGIYFICARCVKVCHNLDEGLVEDENNENNLCVPCSKALKEPVKAASKRATTASRKKTKASASKRPRPARKK